MYIQPQRIDEIRHNQRPVFSEIVQYFSVSSAVFLEIIAYHGKLQTGNEPETNTQSQQHAISNAPMKPFYKKERQQNSNQHTDQKEKGNFLIILADRKIQHRIKSQYQSHKSTITGENINDIHLSHKKFTDTERNSHQCAEKDIQKQSHIIAGKNILIFFLINHIRHVS